MQKGCEKKRAKKAARRADRKKESGKENLRIEADAIAVPTKKLENEKSSRGQRIPLIKVIPELSKST